MRHRPHEPPYYPLDPCYPLDPWQVPPTDDAEWTTPSGWRNQIGVNLRFVPAPVCVATAKTQPPTAPPRWSVDAGPLWVDTMSDEALFLCADHTNSSVLEAFDPADNNGFDRVNSALPTTHVDRMWAFFQGELGRRGVTDSYISGHPDVGGPLLLHQAYGTLPEGALQRAPAQGTPEVLRWGSRYYLYVLRDIAIPIARCLFAAQVSEFCGTVSEFKRTLYHPQSTRCPHLQISFMGTFIELKGGTE